MIRCFISFCHQITLGFRIPLYNEIELEVSQRMYHVHIHLCIMNAMVSYKGAVTNFRVMNAYVFCNHD